MRRTRAPTAASSTASSTAAAVAAAFRIREDDIRSPLDDYLDNEDNKRQPDISMVALKRHARLLLWNCLDEISERKILYVDPELEPALALLADEESLARHGVVESHLFTAEALSAKRAVGVTLGASSRGVRDGGGGGSAAPAAIAEEDETRLSVDVSGVDVAAAPSAHVYLVHPKVGHMRWIAQHVVALQGDGSRGHHVCFVPRQTMLCQRALDVFVARQQLVQQAASPRGAAGGGSGVLSASAFGVKFHELQIDLFPTEVDVLSMHMASAFHDVFVDKDPSSLLYIATALAKLQQGFGRIPSVYYKGAMSLRVATMMRRIVGEKPEAGSEDANSSGTQIPEIDELIIIDRTCDFVTLSLTPLTYEALLDEVRGLESGKVKVDLEILYGDKEARKRKRNLGESSRQDFFFHGGDPVLSDIRDLHWKQATRALKDKVHEFEAMRAEVEDMRAQGGSVPKEQLRQATSKLEKADAEKPLVSAHTYFFQQLHSATFMNPTFLERIDRERRLLSTSSAHANMDEMLEFITQAIAMRGSSLSPPSGGSSSGSGAVVAILRLLILATQTHGIPRKRLDGIWRSFVNTFGGEHVLTFIKLHQIGALASKEDEPQRPKLWPTLRENLSLVSWPDKPTEGDAASHSAARSRMQGGTGEDIHFAFECYAPLSVRLIENASAWAKDSAKKRSDNAMTSLIDQTPGGPAGHFTQELPDDVLELMRGSQRTNKRVMVFFLGGVTRSEIAALRWLSEYGGSPTHYTIAATHIVSGKSLLESLLEKRET